MTNSLIKNGFSAQYRVTDGANFRLADFQTAPTERLNKDKLKKHKKKLVKRISKLQDILYADNKWALLTIFQAMDAGGKDSAVKHLMTGINPQGCEVHSFKRPTTLELDHDFMWRNNVRTPSRGTIGVFNRSYYEEVLVVKVHEQGLNSSKLPKELITEDIWEERFEYIRSFERFMHQNGTNVLKFFLYLSPEEQKKRFIVRMRNPAKNWKFDPNDIYERGFWTEYMRAYEEAIRATATEDSPWYIIPADYKPYSRVVIADAVCQSLKG
ncbi:MAG: polyphosphate kinase 2 family protein [Alcaligenaceae bacterium]|nr:polyphosphate kinase 2 family protein [Alcaligenaceae bacterium]